MSPAVAEALVRHGDQAHALSELNLPAGAGAFELLKTAQTSQLDVLTSEAELVNAVFENRIYFNRVIVFLQLEGADVEQDDAIDRLYQRYKRLTPGRLYTVTGSRVKVRQLPRRA